MGTLVNALAIIAGGLIGLMLGEKLDERYQNTLLKGNAVVVMFLGISGTLSKMLIIENNILSSYGVMMTIVSISIGALIGEFLNIEQRFEQFGEWLKDKTGNAKDNSFVDAFVTSSLTVCIGAMAIVGAIEDGINGDPSILYAKAALDFIIIMVMTASIGKGCIFSAIPVGILQGSATLLAVLIKPLITDNAMWNLSLVGNILIFCVGINLLWPKKVKVANLLPALIVAVLWSFFA